MNTTIRFGRRIPLPPTSIIKHQLRMMAATDALIISLKNNKSDSIDNRVALEEIIADYKLSDEKAHTLMRRLGLDRPGVYDQ